jgi:hypothetical protein
MANRKLPPRLRQEKRKPVTKVGVTWYTEEQWLQVKLNSVDPDRFEATYAEWLEMAEKTLKKFLAARVIAEKVLINAEELETWCIAQGKKNNAAARSEYVSEELFRSHYGDA